MNVEFKELTPATIASRLGLVDPDAFAESMRSFNLQSYTSPTVDNERCTGRTTRMMLSILVEMLRGEQVVVVAENLDICRLIRANLCEYAGRLNIDPLPQVHIMSRSSPGRAALLERGREAKVFEDHFNLL